MYKHKKWTKEYLVQKYINENLNIEDIALQENCGCATVYNHLKKHNIPIRKREKDIAGKKFGNWECECECGHKQSVCGAHLRLGNTTMCKQCQYDARKKGCGKITSYVYLKILSNANIRKLAINVDPEYLWNLFLEQGGKCALTGIEIDFAETGLKHCYGGTTASLDRIDSSIGYIKGNIQWVHKDINRMKWEFSEDYFINMCKLVAEHNKEKVND